MAEMAKAQKREQRIGGSSCAGGDNPILSFTAFKYSRIIALVDTFSDVNITVKGVLLGQLNCC